MRHALGLAVALTATALAAQPYAVPPPVAAPRSPVIAPPVVRSSATDCG